MDFTWQRVHDEPDESFKDDEIEIDEQALREVEQNPQFKVTTHESWSEHNASYYYDSDEDVVGTNRSNSVASDVTGE